MTRITTPAPLACAAALLADAAQARGRPPSPVGAALRRVLDGGHQGTFDQLAQHAGVAPCEARQALDGLRRAGVAQVVAVQRVTPGPGRGRAVFARAGARAHGVLDALAFMQLAWR